ncbi:MAG: ribonuclease III [Chlamydiales bacterium]
MSALDSLKQNLANIEERIGYTFLDKDLLVTAFVHRSFFNEHRTLLTENNERLEFLGDSVLGLIISDFLFHTFPQKPEGELSHFRAQLVEAKACANYIQKLGVGEFVLLGKGEQMNEGRGRETILADFFEALIGAMYLDGGTDVARHFFFTHFQKDLEESLKTPARNWKAELQDFAQKHHGLPPVYKVNKETGPDHSKLFEVSALIDGKVVGVGTGASKKAAEQAAAEDALEKKNKKES